MSVRQSATKALFTALELNANSIMNRPVEIHVLRAKRLSFAAVSAANQYGVGRNADALDQLLTLRVSELTCSGHFSLVYEL